MRWITSLCMALLWAALVLPAAVAQPPNIVLLIADDMGEGDMGCYGNPFLETPNLNSLAAQGMRFDRAFVTTSSCSPSRTAIYTGLYQQAVGAEDLHMPLPEGREILPAILARNGYHTIHVGKLHLGPAAEAQFDYIDARGRLIDTQPQLWMEPLSARPAGRPFFLSLGFSDPHRPYQDNTVDPPTDPADIIVPPYLVDTPATRADLAQYYDEVRRVDHNVGLVVAELERLGVADHTIVIFISDNGMPFPRAKTTSYDSGVRIPMLVRFPGLVGAGTVSRSLVSTIDLAPTILELAGIETPADMHGVSLVPVLRDPTARVREYVHLQRNWHNIDDHQRGVRDERYKYIRNYYPREPLPFASDLYDSPSYGELIRMRDLNRLTVDQLRAFMTPRAAEELYDTQTDPWEFINLAGLPQHAETLERLRGATDRWLERTGDVSSEERRPNDYDVFARKRLRGPRAN